MPILGESAASLYSKMQILWDGCDWNEQSRSPLAKTIGFQALMALLPIIYADGQQAGTLERTYFQGQFQKAKNLSPITFDSYPASGAGERKLFHALKQAIKPT